MECAWAAEPSVQPAQLHISYARHTNETQLKMEKRNMFNQLMKYWDVADDVVVVAEQQQSRDHPFCVPENDWATCIRFTSSFFNLSPFALIQMRNTCNHWCLFIMVLPIHNALIIAHTHNHISIFASHFSCALMNEKHATVCVFMLYGSEESIVGGRRGNSSTKRNDIMIKIESEMLHQHKMRHSPYPPYEKT